MTKYKCIKDLTANCISSGKDDACVFDISFAVGYVLPPVQCPYGWVEIDHHEDRFYPIIRQIMCVKIDNHMEESE